MSHFTTPLCFKVVPEFVWSRPHISRISMETGHNLLGEPAASAQLNPCMYYSTFSCSTYETIATDQVNIS